MLGKSTLALLAFLSSLPPAMSAVAGDSSSPFVGEICTRILVTRTGEYANTMCREALSRALAARLAQDGANQQAETCRRSGLRDGTAAFSMCVLQKRQPDLVAIPTGQAVSLPVDDPYPGNSYTDVTPAARWRRAQYACAQIGLLPARAAFAQCVADIDATAMPGRD